MWRVLTAIGRGFRSARPSQWCPQDCSGDEAPSYHHHHTNEGTSVHKATLRHYSTASAWSPLTVTRPEGSPSQVPLGVTQTNDFHTRSQDSNSPGGDGGNSGYQQRCPPWHWHVLQDNKALQDCCPEEQDERKEKESGEDWGGTGHYQEWKEALQASPTLHTIGLGSAAALTLSIYRDWSEHCPCPYLGKNNQKQRPNDGDEKHNLKSNSGGEEYQKNKDDSSNWGGLKKFFNSENNSQEIPSDTHDEDCSGATYEEPNLSSNTLISTTDVIKTADTESTESLHQESVDAAIKFFNIPGDTEEITGEEAKYEDNIALNNALESLLCVESDKSDVSERADSGCLSDLQQEFQSHINTDSETARGQYNENEDSHSDRSVIGAEGPVVIVPELQVEAKADRNEHSKGSRTHEETEESCTDASETKALCDKLFEIVRADREDYLQELVKKDGYTLLNTKPEEAIVYFQAGVMMGDPSSAFNLGLCYHMGYSVTQDLEKARKLYESAAAAGHGWAMYNLAVMLQQGLGGPCVPQRAHSLLQQAADMGVSEALEALSLLGKEKQKYTTLYEEEPQLRKCYSEPSLHTSLTSQHQHSYSAGDLQSLLDEDVSSNSYLSTDVVCQRN